MVLAVQGDVLLGLVRVHLVAVNHGRFAPEQHEVVAVLYRALEVLHVLARVVAWRTLIR